MQDSIIIGGDQANRPQLPTANEDGTPRLYNVTVKGYKSKQGKQRQEKDGTLIYDNDGNPIFSMYYSWSFEIADGEFEGALVWGSTNDEARRNYNTNQPLKLLQLLIAILGKDVEKTLKGQEFKLADLVGKSLRVELESVSGSDGEVFQKVVRYYPPKA